MYNYYKSVSYFAVGDYKKSLSLVNIVLNDNEQNIRQDIYSFTRIFNLVLHYELENYDFTEYVIKALNRYLNKSDREHITENLLIKSIRTLSKGASTTKQTKIFRELELELTDAFKNIHEQVILEYFDLLAWVRTKTNNSTYSEEVIKSLA